MRVARLVRAVVTSLCLLLGNQVATGATWTTTDGKLSFDVPSPDAWREVANPPAPALVMWEALDGTKSLIFVQQRVPQDVPLDRAVLEKSTKESIQGLLALSWQSDIGDIPSYTIGAKGTANGQPMYVAQRILAFSGTVYMLKASTTSDISADQDVLAVLASVKILDPKPKVHAVPILKRLNDPKLLGKLGACGIIILVIAGLAMRTKKTAAGTAGAAPPPLPPRS